MNDQTKPHISLGNRFGFALIYQCYGVEIMYQDLCDHDSYNNKENYRCNVFEKNIFYDNVIVCLQKSSE